MKVRILDMRYAVGFTLIELLIVVAIIAILAALAVPNYLESQIRAKVSRARADLRSIATALESYAVSWNDYPPSDGKYIIIPIELTTPVAYITSAELIDPFAVDIRKRITLDEVRAPQYTYMKIVTYNEAVYMASRGNPCPYEAIDDPWYNYGAFRKYGKWRMVSIGPDRAYLDYKMPPPLKGSDILYDSTNGSVSFGNILHTQKSSIGEIK